MHTVTDLLNFQAHGLHHLAGIVTELWHHWRYPRISPDDPQIIGFPLIWWGRGGKTLEFISATVIVLDLIGPARLHRWGHKFHRARLYKRLTARWRRLGRILRASVREKLTGGNLGCVIFLGAILTASVPLNLMFYHWWTAGKHSSFWKWYFIVGWIIDAIPSIAILLFLILPPVVIAASYLLTTIAFLVAGALNAILFRPFALILENPFLEWNAKFLAFTALFIGFFFDILAS